MPLQSAAILQPPVAEAPRAVVEFELPYGATWRDVLVEVCTGARPDRIDQVDQILQVPKAIGKEAAFIRSVCNKHKIDVFRRAEILDGLALQA